MSKTKILATLGPACDSHEQIEAMAKAGANVFRFNLKHNSQEWHSERIQRVNDVAKKLDMPLGKFLDLQGPEIRIGTFEDGSLEVEKGEMICFAQSKQDTQKTIIVDNLKLLKSLGKDCVILLDDGKFKFKVVSQKEGHVEAEVIRGGKIGDRKGVNLPDIAVDLPTLVEKDLAHLDMAALHSVDYIALSFARTRQDIKTLREEMHKRDIHADIMAKVENQQAIDNYEEIVDEADGIVVARGDLGVEIELHRLPILQKQMVHIARAHGKPVIIATQMMHSMVNSPSPTRAEVSDIANAVLDDADAVWLSEESAIGQYPVEAVRYMQQIAAYTEEHRSTVDGQQYQRYDSPIAASAFQLYEALKHSAADKIKAFLVLTESGLTARLLAKFRADIPIIAVSDEELTRDKLTVCYGVEPYHIAFKDGEEKSLPAVFSFLKKKQVLQAGDQVIALKGNHWDRSDQTNSISLEVVD